MIMEERGLYWWICTGLIVVVALLTIPGLLLAGDISAVVGRVIYLGIMWIILYHTGTWIDSKIRAGQPQTKTDKE